MKQHATLMGVLTYTLSSLFICYLTFQRIIDNNTYNALFWIILLFTAVTAVSKSFVSENDEEQLYFYSMTSPQAVILAKTVYNALLLLFLSFLSLFIYMLLLGNPIQSMGLYLLTVGLGSMGFATTLSLMSAISGKTGNNPTLMAILSFPVLLPLLMTLMAISKNAMMGLNHPNNLKYIGVLIGINALSLALSYLLFPYLWRE